MLSIEFSMACLAEKQNGIERSTRSLQTVTVTARDM
jgi:hypothetical protein